MKRLWIYAVSSISLLLCRFMILWSIFVFSTVNPRSIRDIFTIPENIRHIAHYDFMQYNASATGQLCAPYTFVSRTHGINILTQHHLSAPETYLFHCGDR